MKKYLTIGTIAVIVPMCANAAYKCCETSSDGTPCYADSADKCTNECNLGTRCPAYKTCCTRNGIRCTTTKYNSLTNTFDCSDCDYNWCMYPYSDEVSMDYTGVCTHEGYWTDIPEKHAQYMYLYTYNPTDFANACTTSVNIIVRCMRGYYGNGANSAGSISGATIPDIQCTQCPSGGLTRDPSDSSYHIYVSHDTYGKPSINASYYDTDITACYLPYFQNMDFEDETGSGTRYYEYNCYYSK